MSMNLRHAAIPRPGCYRCGLRHSCDKLTGMGLSLERRGAIEDGRRVTVEDKGVIPIGYYCVYWE